MRKSVSDLHRKKGRETTKAAHTVSNPITRAIPTQTRQPKYTTAHCLQGSEQAPAFGYGCWGQSAAECACSAQQRNSAGCHCACGSPGAEQDGVVLSHGHMGQGQGLHTTSTHMHFTPNVSTYTHSPKMCHVLPLSCVALAVCLSLPSWRLSCTCCCTTEHL